MFAKRLFIPLAALLFWLTGCGGPPPEPAALRVALVGKGQNQPAWAACVRGAQEAARELGVQLLVEAAYENTPAAQIELIDSLVMRRVDALAVVPHDGKALAPALKRARDSGVRVITFESDADEKRSGRDWFVRPVSDEAMAKALVGIMARLAGPKARTAIVASASPTAGEQIWIRNMRQAIAAENPLMMITEIRRVADDRQAAFQATEEMLEKNPMLSGIFALSPATLPGAAEAAAGSGRKGFLTVTGVGMPNAMRDLVQQGIVRSFVMWNPVDLGYLTVHVAQQTAAGKLPPTAREITAGRLGVRAVRDREVWMGDPVQFNTGNVGKFDF